MTAVDAMAVPGTRPVASVRIPQPTAIRVSARRDPTTSPKMPPGIWKMAYPQANAASTMPSWTLVNPRSAMMFSPAMDMLVRST